MLHGGSMWKQNRSHYKVCSMPNVMNNMPKQSEVETISNYTIYMTDEH